ncbi:hypothetical protein [Paracoccus lutimaris]|uniref:Uncharacterized protein n=1 Tax=Paracoccus lutimaris TaxID=1490030 RepID=A0A368YY40_9RHOB|nr:hypothetical protein [Paracoccus lutimaris]RCW85115.1 hypothetical protein DFP89_106134 [Paracoccus lutimaris]
MSSSITTRTPDLAGAIQPDMATDHGKPLAMPESPMPDWSARNRTPDPLAETGEAIRSAA